MAQNFVHLHVHTEYSLLDGALRLGDLFRRCGELGMPAVALTDHGNMFAACKFDAAAMVETLEKKIEAEDWAKMNVDYKVKPIFGCEFYVTNDMTVKASQNGKPPKLHHLVLLAKNYQGFLNLCRLNAAAYIDGFYYKPRIDHKCLEKYTDGLIGLSACLAGEIPQSLLAGDFEQAKRTAEYYKSLFAPGDFYIELQDHGILDQRRLIPQLVKIAAETGLKPVATNDVHYLEKADAEMQKVLQCISFKRTLSDTLGNAEDEYFPTEEFYLKSADEMTTLFSCCPEAVENTLEIADKCNCLLRYKQDLIPVYMPPDGLTNLEFIRKMTYDGLQAKYPAVTDEIRARAEYELGIISKLGYVDYFLIVWDFIHYAESRGIAVGPGRGSGVGSIVAFAIGITKVDPLRYALFFERFLNEERVSMPDFDIDFCVDRRAEVIRYVIGKYGAERVSQIVTFGTLAMKAAIKDVGRVYGLAFNETNRLTKAIPPLPPTAHVHLGDLLGRNEKKPELRVQELVTLYESDETLRRVLDMAVKVEGFPRQTGMHAAGVVICKNPIADHIPEARSGEDITTQFDMVEVEKLGMLKMDFLGLRTLTDIQAAQGIIQKTRGIAVDFYNNFAYDDSAVFEMIGRGDTHSVFQLESEGMKNFMRMLKPTSLEDIIAGISLFRPGPMDSIKEYVYNKNHVDEIRYPAPCMREILEVTYGCLVYQEQVMQLVQKMAGYSLGGADILRRAMSKKKRDVVEKHRQYFIFGGNADGREVEGALKRGISEAAANEVYDKILKFAEYAFNKSHAAAYAYLSYQTAYLKHYYQAEFITAVLNNRIASSDELKNYLPYAKSRGIAILPPCVNRSDAFFTVENGSIRIGLSAIKNVGVGITERMCRDRTESGDYRDFKDFLDRTVGLGGNKKLYDSLILSGACDCFGVARSSLMQIYPTLIDKCERSAAAAAVGQFSLFDAIDSDEKIIYPAVQEFDHTEKLRLEKEVLNMYISGHPLDAYADALSGPGTTTTEVFFSTGKSDDGEELYENIADGQKVTLRGMLTEAGRFVTKKGLVMGMGKLEDLFGTAEVMCSAKNYEALKDEFVPDAVVALTGRVGLQDGKAPTVWVDSLTPLTKPNAPPEPSPLAEQKINAELHLYFDTERVGPAFQKDLSEILSAHAGVSRVLLCDSATKKTQEHPEKVLLTEALFLELASILPEEDIRTRRLNI